MAKEKNPLGLDYPYEDAPAVAEKIEVAPGVYWLRMPLPFYLDHINVWLLQDGDGWSIVDTGLATDDTVMAWKQVHENYAQGRSLKKVIVTHMHPDHVGLAGWLVRRSSAKLWMARSEYLYCSHLLNYSHDEPPQEGLDFYRAAGFDEEQLDYYRSSFGGFGRAVRGLPHSFIQMSEGDHIQIGDKSWDVIVGHGHSPEHACLYNREDNVLISGDQLLPRISSNVSVWPTEPTANPLEDWINSCKKMLTEIDKDALVLPSHGKPFYGAHKRLQSLIDTHEADLEKLYQFCEQPRRAVDAFSVLFKTKIDRNNLIMAAGESLANFNCLVARGILQVSKKDGVNYYHRG